MNVIADQIVDPSKRLRDIGKAPANTLAETLCNYKYD